MVSLSCMQPLKIEVYFDELINDSDQDIAFKFISAQHIPQINLFSNDEYTSDKLIGSIEVGPEDLARLQSACFIKIKSNKRKKFIFLNTCFEEVEGEKVMTFEFKSGLILKELWKGCVEKDELLKFKFAMRYDGAALNPTLERIDVKAC